MIRLRPGDGVHSAADRDGAVLLHSARDRLYGLNPTAAALWELLRAGTELHEAAAVLSDRWGVDEGRVRSDSLAFVDSLVRRGLAVPGEGPR